MFEHDIFSPPDMGGPLGALAIGDGLQPWEPQLVPQVSGGQLYDPIAIRSVTITGGALDQTFTPTPLPLAQTSRVVAPIPALRIAATRAGVTRPLSLLPGTAPSGGVPIPLPGAVPPPPGAPAPTSSSLPSWVLPVALIGGGLLIGAYVLASSKKKATPNSRGWSRTEREAKGRRRRARRRHGRRKHRVLSALHNSGRSKKRRSLKRRARREAYWARRAPMHEATYAEWGTWHPNKGKPRIVSGHPATRRCPHCGGAHSRSAHWSHMRGHHRQGPKGGTYYGHVR
jgi:hypothetical protein